MATVQFCNVRGEPQGEQIAMGRRHRRLSAVVAKHVPATRPFMVSVHRGVQPGDKLAATDDTSRCRNTWKDTPIGADDIVLVTYLPLGRGGAGGGGQGKQIGMAVAMIALAVAMPAAVGAMGGAMTLAAGGLSFAGKAVAAALTAGIPVAQSMTFERYAA